MTKTIDPQTVADLYDEYEERDDTPEAAADSEPVDGWTVVGSSAHRTSRWHERFWLVLREEATGEEWGVDYGIGLTEDQENDLPWDEAKGLIRLVRLYPHTVTTVVYQTKPSTEATR